MRFLWLLLLPCMSFAAEPGTTGWTCAAYLNLAALDGSTLTVDSGSNRIFVATFASAFVEDTEVSLDSVGGQAPTGSATYDSTTGENAELMAWVFSESAVSSMSGSDIAISGTHGDDLVFCYVTLVDSNDDSIASFAYTDTSEASASTTVDVTTTSVATDYVCVLGYHELAATAWTDWDTLTEIDDRDTNNGGRSGLACGAGGDSTTTATAGSSTDITVVSMVFNNASSAAVLRRRR